MVFSDNRESIDDPKQRLSAALQQKDQVVSAVVMAAESISGLRRRKLLKLSNRIAYTTDVEAIVRNPLVLEIFLPLTQRASAVPDQRLDQSEVDQIVCRVLQNQSAGATPTSDKLVRLAYPLTVLLICAAVLFGICALLVPEFERMFREFGLDLPAPTRLLIAISHAARSPIVWGLFALVVAVLAALLWRQFAFQWRWRRSSVDSAGRLSRISTRGLWANWAWHLSLLIEAGFSNSEGIEIAGASSQDRWLQQGSQMWARQLRAGSQPFKSVTHFRGEPCHLLAYALNLNEPAAPNIKRSVTSAPSTPSPPLRLRQAGLLREVAEIYWDRDQLRSTWWWSWLSPLTVVLVGLIVGFVVLSLFMPLISLISGLG